MEEIERYRGCLVGMAVGDALGAAVEFQPPGSFPPVREMLGGGPFHLKPGQWTDDTAMALCLADSLLSRGGFDPRDQLVRYLNWYRHGYLSSTGTCFDIGGTVRAALERFEATGSAYCGSLDPNTAGNGSLMRLAPVPLFYARRPWEALQWAADSSRTTHATAVAVDACRYYAGLIVGALRGEAKEALTSAHYSPVEGYWKTHPLHPEIDHLAAGSFRRNRGIRGQGGARASLEAALWAFHTTESYEEAVLAGVNLGEDADTVAAICGQLAGAFYGHSAIPERWRAQIAHSDLVHSFADRLHEARVPAPGA